MPSRGPLSHRGAVLCEGCEEDDHLYVSTEDVRVSVTIQRLQVSSPPLGGTFRLHLGSTVISGKVWWSGKAVTTFAVSHVEIHPGKYRREGMAAWQISRYKGSVARMFHFSCSCHGELLSDQVWLKFSVLPPHLFLVLLRTWLSGHSGGVLMVGRDDLSGLFQP